MGELTSHKAPSILRTDRYTFSETSVRIGSNRFGRVTEFKIFLGPSLSRKVQTTPGLTQDLNDFGFCGILARAGMCNVRLSKYSALRNEW